MDSGGWTLVQDACKKHHLPVCQWQWLVVNGALNNPATGRVDKTLVERDVILSCRPDLLARAQDILITHGNFLGAVLRGSVLVHQSPQHANPHQHCCLLSIGTTRGVMELVGGFLGVKKGREMREVNEFVAILGALA